MQVEYNQKTETIELLNEHKAQNIVAFDLTNKSALTDQIILATGGSSRHIKALADYLLRRFKKLGVKNLYCEGLDDTDWVLIDTGDIIIHLFSQEMRDFYNLESMWQDIIPEKFYVED